MRAALDVVAPEAAATLATEAVREAIRNAGIDLYEPDAVINASDTPRQSIPYGSGLLQNVLGHGEAGITCPSVHATCLSFVVALETAAMVGT